MMMYNAPVTLNAIDVLSAAKAYKKTKLPKTKPMESKLRPTRKNTSEYFKECIKNQND